MISQEQDVVFDNAKVMKRKGSLHGTHMSWDDSLKGQLAALSNAIASLERNGQMDSIVRLTRRVKGFHFFTGVGKNGYVAEKTASTFNSLGIRSMFVDPVHTLHGDMNIFSSNDILYSISKSGETEELIRFHNALRNNGFRRICLVTSSPRSSLASLSQTTLVVPITTEADHLELAPVASSLVFMAVLQAVAVDLSSRRGFSKRDFVRGHPGGTLGKVRVGSGTS